MQDSFFAPDTGPTWRPRGQLAPVTGGQASSPATQFYNSQEWGHLRGCIMDALQHFPEARDSLVSALRALNALDQTP